MDLYDGHDPANWLLQKIHPQGVYVQHSKRRVGNNEGFELLDMFKQLEVCLWETRNENTAIREENAAIREKITDIQKKVSVLKAAHRALRHGVLEERRITNRKQLSSARQRRIVRGRNMIAHGGDILGDLEAIRYVEENGLPYVTEYKDDFQKAYGLRFSKALAKLPSFPEQVIRTFNILASVRELSMWRECKTRKVKRKRDAIQTLASEIIKAALDADISQLAACFEEGGNLAKKYSKMERLFNQDIP
ncbi:hypothetical protein MPDQ_002380 [Monascus purpureus]|uniref:Uncharacterized protein n=1 Tax=Monascus purpureus TaxID=5098 RepID=A0A507QPP3_MONPU|nr:hypothetical protein MPDQ_002380 [Monascus purpureus]